MIHTHERILGNICDNYTVLGDILLPFRPILRNATSERLRNLWLNCCLLAVHWKTFVPTNKLAVTNCDKQQYLLHNSNVYLFFMKWLFPPVIATNYHLSYRIGNWQSWQKQTEHSTKYRICVTSSFFLKKKSTVIPTERLLLQRVTAWNCVQALALITYYALLKTDQYASFTHHWRWRHRTLTHTYTPHCSCHKSVVFRALKSLESKQMFHTRTLLN